jgi:hypothetical protein
MAFLGILDWPARAFFDRDRNRSYGLPVFWEGLVAEACADRYAFAADGAAAAEHGSAGFGLHARPESVGFHAVAAVGLKCTLGHRYPLLLIKENLRFSSIFEYTVAWARNPAPRPSAS